MSEADDTDMLAAEYALGTLDAAERAAVEGRLGADPALARAVAAWEERLSPLLDAVPDAAPPEGAYAAIAARLFGAPADPAIMLLRRRLRGWQAAAGGFGLLAAGLALWIAARGAGPAEGAGRYTAVLQRDAGAPAMVVEVDLAARRLTVRPVAAPAPAGRAYELWIIDPALGHPRSLGLVPAAGEARDTLASFDAGVIAGATYAVTVEEPGGSRTGLPTAAPVLSGRLSPVPP